MALSSGMDKLTSVSMYSRPTGIAVACFIALMVTMLIGCSTDTPRQQQSSPGASATSDAARGGASSAPADSSNSGSQRTDTGTTVSAATEPVKPAEPAADTAPASAADAKKAIADRAAQTLRALKAKDMDSLAAVIHSQKGVRFSPYANVDPAADLRIEAKDIPSRWKSGKIYTWGYHDGSDDPIALTFAGYYKRYVYDHDYSQAKRVAYNGGLLGHGNTMNNIHEIYPHAIVVEYNFPGFDPKFEQMDWRSLWLVFEKNGSAWYLVGIVHGEWTI